MKIKKRYWMGVVLLILVLKPYDYRCYNCFHDTSKNEWLKSIRGQECDHKWKVNSYMLGVADCFASHRIPLHQVYQIREVFGQIPKEYDKKTIIAALTDEDNLLKWLLVDSLNAIRMNYKKNPSQNSGLNVFKENFEILVTPEYDLEEARRKAKIVLAYNRQHALYKSDSGRYLQDLQLRRSSQGN